ncbi:MAG: MASE3 domain-containing protein [Bacillota bacterium]|nr:MASE3 domain-containing protein [Bacillota bacterium]
MKKNFLNYKISKNDILILIAVFIVTFFVHRHNDDMFHIMIELITVAIGFSLMLISIGTLKICENSFFSFLGIVYGFVSVLDLFHIVTYHGILPFSSSMNISLQFRLAARFYESILLFCSLYYLNHKLNFKRNIIINTLVSIFIIVMILLIKVPLKFYIDGQGVTKIKRIIEVGVCLIFVFFAVVLNKKLKEKNFDRINEFMLTIIFKIISEIFFASYVNIGDFGNYIAHFFKFISFFYLYKTLISSVIIYPYSVIFNSLNTKAIELIGKNKELLNANARIEKDCLEYKRIIESMPDGIVISEGGKIVYVNDRICEMVGIRDKAEIINKLISTFTYRGLNKNIGKINQIFDGNKMYIPNLECELIYKDRVLPVEITCINTNIIDGNPSSISAIRDISYRKKAEEIEVLLKEKEHEDFVKNEFFANISHELRTPISVIYSAIQLEEKYIEQGDVKQIAKYNKTIKQNCLRLTRIVNNIIDITRIETGFFKPEFRIENIVDVVENITSSIISYAEIKKIKVIFDTEFEEVYISCDVNLIERIILNLLSNSVKYGRENGNIDVSININENNFVSISVKDDGIGIPENMKEKIFERFQKVDKSMSRNSEGSGIGLSLVKSLVEIQKGVISINSKIDKGTEFIIKFPIIKLNDEVSACTINEYNDENKEIEEKAKIEFSDIYN